eukprot:5180014-Amphidinium_carterae.1
MIKPRKLFYMAIDGVLMMLEERERECKYGPRPQVNFFTRAIATNSVVKSACGTYHCQSGQIDPVSPGIVAAVFSCGEANLSFAALTATGCPLMMQLRFSYIV